MKAEALVRKGSAGAKALVDQVRQRAGLASLAAEPTLDAIYDERGRELAWEGHRRQDMIRFGKFLLPHDFKGASDQRYLLFPIPGPALDANRNLKQNTGY
jgi:starch-binding outer membrane protein, SusD/RagB family